MSVYRVEIKEDVAEGNSLIAELDENGRKESMGVLFSGVPRVEKEIRYACRTGCGNAFDILDDRRAGDDDQVSKLPLSKCDCEAYARTVLPEPAREPEFRH